MTFNCGNIKYWQSNAIFMIDSEVSLGKSKVDPSNRIVLRGSAPDFLGVKSGDYVEILIVAERVILRKLQVS